MSSIRFWESWTSLYQRLFWTCTIFLALGLGFLSISNLNSPAPVFTPDHFVEFEPQEIPVHVFQKGATTLTISAENYLVFDHLLGSELKPNKEGSYLFLALLMMGITILLSVLTTMKRFWFYMGMGLFTLLIVSFRLETLLLFGIDNKLPVLIVLLTYGLAGYYFQFLRPSESFLKRVGVFLGITLVIGGVIFCFSKLNDPFYSLSASGLMAGTILTLLFIFTVAHEIVAWFIVALTNRKKPTKSLRHFLFISTIYFVNLGLIYADKKHLIEWNYYSINLFLLLTISGILGIWGFRYRASLYESIMRADPFGSYFFMALGGIGFSTIGYLLATANDPVVQIINDSILYSHLGYGAIFFIYIIANFISPLGANLQVHKVLYKPSTMPYFTFRIAGLIATFAFFAYSNYQVSVHQVYAGYYNAMGDFYLSQDSLRQAEDHYKQSSLHVTRNYHAHYALAEFDASRYEFVKEKEELEKLANGRPLDLAYLNLCNLYEAGNLWRAAIDVLKAGLLDFPQNGLLQNEIGLNYARLENRDSAVLMIQAARNTASSRSPAETNLMGLRALFKAKSPADSSIGPFNQDNPGVVANALALASLQKISFSAKVDPGSDTLLTPFSVASLNNYLLNHLTELDTALVTKIVTLLRRPSNSQFKNILLSSAAHACYAAGHITKAFKLMHEVAFIGQQPKSYNMLGLWSLDQGAPQMATFYFDQALLKDFRPAYFNRALSLIEAGDFAQGMGALDSLSKSADVKIQNEANRIKKFLTLSPLEAISLGDMEKFEFSRHRFALQQQADFVRFINYISDPDIRTLAIVDRSKKLEEADEIEMVLSTLGLAKDISVRSKDVREEILHIMLRCLARQENPDLSQHLSFVHNPHSSLYNTEAIYYLALDEEQKGKRDSTALISASRKFEWLATADPFFEDAIIAAARFETENGTDGLKSYSILINALDMNPNSVKLLKAYFVYAAHLDFDEAAKAALDKLHNLLSREGFLRFAKENPEIFDINTN